MSPFLSREWACCKIQRTSCVVSIFVPLDVMFLTWEICRLPPDFLLEDHELITDTCSLIHTHCQSIIRGCELTDHTWLSCWLSLKLASLYVYDRTVKPWTPRHEIVCLSFWCGLHCNGSRLCTNWRQMLVMVIQVDALLTV